MSWNGYQQPQQTGYQPQQGLYGQQPQLQPGQQQQQQAPSAFGRAPAPQPSFGFLNAPPPQSQFGGGGGGGLQPQATGWAGAGQGGFQAGGGLRPQQTGMMLPQQTGMGGGWSGGPLQAQPTGFHDPRLQMMQSSFMPANVSSPYASSGMPVFQQASLPASSLQSSMTMMNQNRSVATPKIPWKLTKDEKKNYDQIFRAWDQQGTGFISGEIAQDVFGQSGLSRDNMAKIWTLADIDNRGKLNIQEFHVAMGLIYRSLNGNEVPDVLPPDLVPASARDLESSADFLKNLLRTDTNTRSTNGDDFSSPSYAKSRSFNSSPAQNSSAARKDGTNYKHDEERGSSQTYKSSNRHLDRASVRTGNESASDDLSDLKRQLANTSDLLDKNAAYSESRSREDEDLDREMDDLRYRIRRVRDDIDHASKGRRTAEKDEERRKLERELLYLSHEKIPELEKKIEARDERKRRDERDGVKARDRRNDRYGGRYEDDEGDRYGGRYEDDEGDRYGDRYGRDRDRDEDRGGYMRGTYDRDRSRDRDDGRDRRRGSDDDYRNSDRDRPRSPPPAPAPPAHSLEAPPAPAPPKPATPTPSNLTPEQRKEASRQRALQKIQDRMRALGIETPTEEAVDTSVAERIAREKKEAEELAKKSETDRAEKEAARQARLDSERASRGDPPKPPAATAPPPSSAPAKPTSGKAPPPPPTSRSILKKAPPAPAPKSQTAPTPASAPAPAEPEVDPEEERLREREERLKKAAAARAERMRELERQEEEERLAEEQFNARRANKTAVAAQPASSPPVEASAAADPPAPASTSSHNPFHRLGAGAGAAAASPTSPASVASPPSSLGSSNPFFKPQTAGAAPSPSATSPEPKPAPATFVAAPVARAPPPKSAYVPPPADDDWDVIEEKDNDSDSDSDYETAKKRKADLARALLGGFGGGNSTPKPASPAPGSGAPARVNPMLAQLGGSGGADPSARGGLFASIAGGGMPKLKKTVTVDKSGPELAGSVIGDAAPPAHINLAPRVASPPPARAVSPPAAVEEPERSLSKDHRQSVDWYQGLASNGGVAGEQASKAPALSSQAEDDEDSEEKALDPLDAVDLSTSIKVRTLYSYEGQRPEDLSFVENLLIDAHPSKDDASPWYYGISLRDRKSGWFPSSYVVEIPEVVQAKALYSYTGTTDEEMPFTEGDVLTVVDRTDDAWWKASSGGVVFLVPASYLELSG